MKGKNYITKYLEDYTPLLSIMVYGIDDDQLLLAAYVEKFKEVGLTNYRLFTKGKAMIENLNEDVQIAIIDYHLNDEITGKQIMDEILKVQPLCKCIFVSAQDDMDVVIEVANAGAIYIQKKGEFLERLIYYIDRAAREWDKQIRETLRRIAPLKSAMEALEQYKKALEVNNA